MNAAQKIAWEKATASISKFPLPKSPEEIRNNLFPIWLQYAKDWIGVHENATEEMNRLFAAESEEVQIVLMENTDASWEGFCEVVTMTVEIVRQKSTN